MWRERVRIQHESAEYELSRSRTDTSETRCHAEGVLCLVHWQRQVGREAISANRVSQFRIEHPSGSVPRVAVSLACWSVPSSALTV